MKRFLKLFRTLILLGILVWWSITIYAHYTQETQTTVDPVQQIRNLYQTWWYDTKREYNRDIEQLQRLKQEELDQFDYKATISFYQSGTYDVIQVPQETIDKLNKIDSTINIAITKRDMIIDPEYLAKKEEPIPVQETADFLLNLWR